MRTQYLVDASNSDRWLGELLLLVRARVKGDTLTDMEEELIAR